MVELFRLIILICLKESAGINWKRYNLLGLFNNKFQCLVSDDALKKNGLLVLTHWFMLLSVLMYMDFHFKGTLILQYILTCVYVCIV